MRGDEASLPPPLDGGVIGVPESGGTFSNAAEATDDFLGGFHARNVRTTRTSVNLECVRTNSVGRGMAKTPTIGEQIKALADRTKLRGDRLAQAMGLGGRSSIQRYMLPEYDLPLRIPQAKKMAAGLVGKGEPPISEAEIMQLTGLDAAGSNSPEVEAPTFVNLRVEFPSVETLTALFDTILEDEIEDEERRDELSKRLAQRFPRALGRVTVAPPVRRKGVLPDYDEGSQPASKHHRPRPPK